MNEPFEVIYNWDDYLIFRVSELTRCPFEIFCKRLGLTEFDEETIEILEKGSEIHYIIEHLNDNARGRLESESRTTILEENKSFGISGQFDEVWIDPAGLYILDYKSGKYGSFYYFLKKESPDYIFQLSLYAYLYYIKENFWISKGVVCRVDRTNIRNRIQREFDLYTPETAYLMVMNHSLILYLTRQISFREFLNRCWVELEKWKCDYCSVKDCYLKKKKKNE